MAQIDSKSRGIRDMWTRVKSSKLFWILVIIAGIWVFALGISYVSLRSRADNVLRAVRASFPDFCPDGQILVELDPIAGSTPGRYWGIKCDTWMKSPVGFYSYETIIDADQCTTVRPVIGTLSTYMSEFEAINSTNGKKMAVCP